MSTVASTTLLMLRISVGRIPYDHPVVPVPKEKEKPPPMNALPSCSCWMTRPRISIDLDSVVVMRPVNRYWEEVPVPEVFVRYAIVLYESTPAESAHVGVSGAGVPVVMYVQPWVDGSEPKLTSTSTGAARVMRERSATASTMSSAIAKRSRREERYGAMKPSFGEGE